MSLDYEKFGHHVKNIRKQLKLTRVEVFNATGITIETQRRLEHAVGIVKLSTLENLSNFYKVDLIYFLSKTREKTDLFNQKFLIDTNKPLSSGEFSSLRNEANHMMKIVKKTDQNNVLYNYLRIFTSAERYNFRYALTNIIELEEMLKETNILVNEKKSEIALYDVELVLSNILATKYRIAGDFENAIILVKKIILYIENLVYMTLVQNDILCACYLNYATILHRQDKQHEVIKLVDSVQRNRNISIPYYINNDFIFRKLVSLHILGEKLYLRDALITMLLDNEMKERTSIYVESLKNQYNIEHPLL